MGELRSIYSLHLAAMEPVSPEVTESLVFLILKPQKRIILGAQI